MGSRLRCASLIVMLAACGHGEPMDASSGDGQDAASTAPDDSTSSSATSSSATSSSAGSTTDGSATTASTSAVDGSASSESGTTTEDPTVADSSGGSGTAYAAVAIPGGLNRIRVTKRDDDAGLCTYLTLVDPSGAGMFEVDVTRPWGLEFANISDAVQACASDRPAMFGGEAALEASGTITLGDAGAAGFPCTLDVDVAMTFPAVTPGIPEMDAMVANGIAIEGC